MWGLVCMSWQCARGGPSVYIFEYQKLQLGIADSRVASFSGLPFSRLSKTVPAPTLTILFSVTISTAVSTLMVSNALHSQQLISAAFTFEFVALASPPQTPLFHYSNHQTQQPNLANLKLPLSDIVHIPSALSNWLPRGVTSIWLSGIP
jgi:hypothetical protein